MQVSNASFLSDDQQFPLNWVLGNRINTCNIVERRNLACGWRCNLVCTGLLLHLHDVFVQHSGQATGGLIHRFANELNLACLVAAAARPVTLSDKGNGNRPAICQQRVRYRQC